MKKILIVSMIISLIPIMIACNKNETSDTSDNSSQVQTNNESNNSNTSNISNTAQGNNPNNNIEPTREELTMDNYLKDLIQPSNLSDLEFNFVVLDKMYLSNMILYTQNNNTEKLNLANEQYVKITAFSEKLLVAKESDFENLNKEFDLLLKELQDN